MKLSLLYTTFPTQEGALLVVRQLLAQRLLACANILGPIISVYTWNDTQEEAQEIAVLLKTTAEKADLLREGLLALHPYETPAILEIPVNKCPPAFGQWVYNSVN